MNIKKPVTVELKQKNRSSIYQHFFIHDALTKQKLVSDLQLCLPTVTKNIDLLLADGLIKQSGSQGHTGGRRAATYSLVKDARIALGIDLTMHHVTAVAVDLSGTIIASVRNRRKFEPDAAYYQYVADTLEQLVETSGIRAEQILGVGIGLPALVDADRKNIFFSKIIDLSRTTLDDFARCIPYKIELFNDANAAAYTETWASTASPNVFYLMLSNNIGGSMTLNGVTYRGNCQRSGEIGHVPLVPGGRPCYCGQYGCVDAYLAATNLSDLTGGNLQEFFDQLQAGNQELNEKWNEYLEHLAATINIIHVLLDCDIILGGYVGEYLEPYMDELRRRTARLSTFPDTTEYLHICSYKKESIAAGAALNFISDFIKSI